MSLLVVEVEGGDSHRHVCQCHAAVVCVWIQIDCGFNWVVLVDCLPGLLQDSCSVLSNENSLDHSSSNSSNILWGKLHDFDYEENYDEARQAKP